MGAITSGVAIGPTPFGPEPVDMFAINVEQPSMTTPTREPLVELAERLHVGDMTRPDYEELFRIIRTAGVTNASKAQAVYEALKPAATALEEQPRRGAIEIAKKRTFIQLQGGRPHGRPPFLLYARIVDNQQTVDAAETGEG